MWMRPVSRRRVGSMRTKRSLGSTLAGSTCASLRCRHRTRIRTIKSRRRVSRARHPLAARVCGGPRWRRSGRSGVPKLPSRPACKCSPRRPHPSPQAAGRAFETQVLDTAPTLPRMMATWSATDGLPRCMRVLDTAPSWVEWVGRSVLATNRASQSTGQLEACVKALAVLLSHLRAAVERSIHVRLLAQLLAADDDMLAARRPPRKPAPSL